MTTPPNDSSNSTPPNGPTNGPPPQGQQPGQYEQPPQYQQQPGQQPQYQQQPGQQQPGQQPQYQQQPDQYQQQPQGQYAQPPAPPKKKKTGRNIAIGCLGLIVLVIIIVVAVTAGGGGGDASTGAEQSQSEGAPAEEAPAEEAPAEESAEEGAATGGIGEAVTAGDLVITVAAAEGGIESVGPEGLEETPSGQFYRVDVEVSNNGTEPGSLSSSDFTLLDANGASYSTSDAVFLEEILLFEEINPGNTYTGALMFDIPADVEPTSVEFLPTFSFDSPVEITLQ